MPACILIFSSHRPSFAAHASFFTCVSTEHEYIQSPLFQEEFDKSLTRLDTREANLSRSYNNDDSDDEDNCGNEVVAAGEALDDLASELARAEVEMLGQNSSSASEDIDTSAVAQAAAAKALAKRKQASSDGNPRAAMLAAISSRKQPDENETEEASSAPVQGFHDPRAAMLAAISSRKKPDDEEGETETTPTLAHAPAPLDPRSVMLAAISSRKKPEEEAASSPASAPAPLEEEAPASAQAPVDPRAAMLAAITSRKKAEDDKTNEDTSVSIVDDSSQSVVAEGGSTDPRSSILSAIRSRKVDSSGSETKEEKGTAQDPRAGLLASIQARRVD